MDMEGGPATKKPEHEPQPVDRPRRLYRTVIEVWTDTPTDDLDFADLAQQVEREEAYAQVVSGGWVSNPAEFPQTDFFGNPEREVG